MRTLESLNEVLKENNSNILWDLKNNDTKEMGSAKYLDGIKDYYH